jgi:hypothetical protein
MTQRRQLAVISAKRRKRTFNKVGRMGTLCSFGLDWNGARYGSVAFVNTVRNVCVPSNAASSSSRTAYGVSQEMQPGGRYVLYWVCRIRLWTAPLFNGVTCRYWIPHKYCQRSMVLCYLHRGLLCWLKFRTNDREEQWIDTIMWKCRQCYK